MKLSIVIVSYNVKYFLDQCLRSVLRAIDTMQQASGAPGGDGHGCEAEVVVVDNHSKDGSVEYLRSRYPADRYPMVRFLECSRNLGFAAANNLAIRHTRGEYVLLLNPDTIVGEHVLLGCVEFLDAHADAGALGVRMLTESGVAAKESRRGIPTPMVAFFKMAGFSNRWPSHPLFGRYYMGFLPWNSACRIEVVSGAFCMLRREALDKVGLLDEDFFMYGEDIDLSCRILEGGYHNYYLPLDILHYKGESTEKSGFRYVHVFYKAMLVFYRKHNAGASLLLSLPIKGAIYASASLALVKLLSGRLRKSLGFVRPSRKERARYVLMDADKLSYEQMLKQLSAQERRDAARLATYCRGIGKVITGQGAMELDEFEEA